MEILAHIISSFFFRYSHKHLVNCHSHVLVSESLRPLKGSSFDTSLESPCVCFAFCHFLNFAVHELGISAYIISPSCFATWHAYGCVAVVLSVSASLGSLRTASFGTNLHLPPCISVYLAVCHTYVFQLLFLEIFFPTLPCVFTLVFSPQCVSRRFLSISFVSSPLLPCALSDMPQVCFRSRDR